MARTTLDNVLSLPDSLSAESFTLEFGRIPGGFSSRALTLKCQSVPLPGVSNEKLITALSGFEVGHRGRPVQSHNVTASFIETVDGSSLGILRAWHDFVVDMRSGLSRGYKNQYACDTRLTLFDVVGKAVHAYNIYNLFPESIEDTSLDGASTQAVLVSAGFHFDISEPASNTAFLS